MPIQTREQITSDGWYDPETGEITGESWSFALRTPKQTKQEKKESLTKKHVLKMKSFR